MDLEAQQQCDLCPSWIHHKHCEHKRGKHIEEKRSNDAKFPQSDISFNQNVDSHEISNIRGGKSKSK